MDNEPDDILNEVAVRASVAKRIQTSKQFFLVYEVNGEFLVDHHITDDYRMLGALHVAVKQMVDRFFCEHTD